MKRKIKLGSIITVMALLTIISIAGIVSFIELGSKMHRCEERCMPIHTEDWSCETTCLEAVGAPRIFWQD